MAEIKKLLIEATTVLQELNGCLLTGDQSSRRHVFSIEFMSLYNRVIQIAGSPDEADRLLIKHMN